MRQAKTAQARLQKLWDGKRKSEATIDRLLVKTVGSHTRYYWCAIFRMSEMGRGFIILGGNPQEARQSIISGSNWGRGTYRI